MSASPQRDSIPKLPEDVAADAAAPAERSCPTSGEGKPASSSADDDRLAELLEALTVELRAGRMPDVQAVCRSEPQLASELMRLWPAVLIAEDMASDVLAWENRGRGSDAAADQSQPVNRAVVAGNAGTIEPSPLSPSGGSGLGLRLPCEFGTYRLQAELGRGGMGVVYQAYQPALGRAVALKMLRSGDGASDEEVSRFRLEAEAAARLEHPHIVPLYEVGAVAGRPYFTMKLVRGTTLARRLAEGPLPPREAAELLAVVAEAIDFAHGHGVLHRDLKPSNILIDEHNRPHVSDFGLARQVDAAASLTRSGAVIGTPAYMAPEQAAGGRGELGPAGDVYSLGAILYQMLTGRPPFQAASPVDTVLLVLEQDPVPPRVLNPKADRDLEMIALHCLQKLPELRYATAGELAADLRAYLAGEPIAARSGAFRQVIGRWFRETHHATILENWGLLWMLHSAALLIVCVLTNAMQLAGVTSAWPYVGLWTVGLGTWAAVFWWLRHRAGPVTFVERQIAHIWAGSMAAIGLLFLVERLLVPRLPVLSLAPVLALVSGSTFLAKAGVLSGRFYIQAVLLYLTAIPMAIWPRYGISIFGLVAAASFFVPGLKYYRQRAEKG